MCAAANFRGAGSVDVTMVEDVIDNGCCALALLLRAARARVCVSAAFSCGLGTIELLWLCTTIDLLCATKFRLSASLCSWWDVFFFLPEARRCVIK